MALPTPTVIRTLKDTLARLQSGARYQWTHQGACNCGHLAQTLTELSPSDLHAYALEKSGDWAEHVRAYCPQSGYPIDLVIHIMLQAGFALSDLERLEQLNDPQILARIDNARKPLQRNSLPDLLLYLESWIVLLEEAQPETEYSIDTQALSAAIY